MSRKSVTIWTTTAQGALLGIAGAAAIFAIGMLIIPDTARAASADLDVSIDATCVKGCVTDLRTCLADAREAFVECSAEGGCASLAAAARVACAPDKQASVCIDARAEVTDCLKPCRTALRTDAKACQNDSFTCLRDECGLTDLPGQCGGPVSITVY